MVHFIPREMHGHSYENLIAREHVAKPILWGELGKLIAILFAKYGWFSPIRFQSYGILYHMEIAWVLPSMSHCMRKHRKTLLSSPSVQSISHSMVHYIKWMVHRFSHEIPITWLNSAKLSIIYEEPEMLIPVPFFKIWVIFLPSNFCPMGYWKKIISTNSWDNVSPSPCNFHWMSLRVFCYSSSIAWNKKNFWKLPCPQFPIARV